MEQSSPKKILLVSVSAGAGHIRAAEALRKTAEASFPSLSVTHIDMMNYVKTPFKHAFVDTYELMIKQVPGLFGYIYKKTNRTEKVEKYRDLTKYISRLNATAFYEYVQQENPDHIICTHFLPAQTLLEMPKKYGKRIPTSFVITDYDRHALFTCPGVAHYFVATDKMKWKMVASGIDETMITASGIPIDPIFSTLPPRTELRKKYDVPDDRNVFIVMSGGQGMGKMSAITKALFQLTHPTTLFVITGKNKQQAKEIQALTPPKHIDVRVIGWTDVAHEYMHIADAVITKPGGLTTSECIALQKPIIAVNPIPGHEEENVEFILEHGYGVVARSVLDLLYYTSQPAQSLAEGHLHHHRQKTKAAHTILQKILTL